MPEAKITVRENWFMTRELVNVFNLIDDRTVVTDSENDMVTVLPTYLKIRRQKLSNVLGTF